MAANATDKFKKGASLFSTTLSSPIGSTDLTIPLNSVTGLSTGTGVTLTIDATNSSGTATPSLREVVTGTISGSNLILPSTAYRGLEGTAQSHTSGAVVTERFTKTHWDDMIDGLLVNMNQDGSFKPTTIYDTNSNKTFEFGLVSSAVNNIKATNAASGNNPFFSVTGGSNRGYDAKDSNGNYVWTSAPVASAVNYLEIVNSATGAAPGFNARGTDSNVGITLTPKGTGAFLAATKTAQQQDQSGNSVTIDPMQRNEGFQGYDFVQTGLNPTSAAGLVVTIPSGTYYIAGKRYTYGGGTKTITASKDAYLDIDTSGAITSVEVANGATTGMTLTANSVRFAKVVSGASTITTINYAGYLSTGTLNASHGFDPLGYLLRNTSPYPRKISYLRNTGTGTSTSANTQIDGIVVQVPSANKLITVRGSAPFVRNSASGGLSESTLWDGTAGSGTELQRGDTHAPGVNLGSIQTIEWEGYLSAGQHTINLALSNATGTAAWGTSGTGASYRKLEAEVAH